MDPNVDKPTGFSLPVPVETVPSGTSDIEAATPQRPELAPAPMATPSTTTQMSTPSMPIVATALSQASAVSGAQTGSSTGVDSPSSADDGDLIEKEWVAKAKMIVDKTKEDPYAQNKELNKFKADYIQKRYNKTIKLSE